MYIYSRDTTETKPLISVSPICNKIKNRNATRRSATWLATTTSPRVHHYANEAARVVQVVFISLLMGEQLEWNWRKLINNNAHQKLSWIHLTCTSITHLKQRMNQSRKCVLCTWPTESYSSQSFFLPSHLSLARAYLLMTSLSHGVWPFGVLAVNGGASVGECGRLASCVDWSHVVQHAESTHLFCTTRH